MNRRITNNNPEEKLFFWINFFLGLLLACFLITNLEWNSVIANSIFPVAVFIIAYFSGKYARNHFGKQQRRKLIWVSILSYSIPILYFLYYIFFLTIGIMSFMFSVSEEQNKVKIQSIYSPNRTRYCEVFFAPVGSYAAGTGKLTVYCINTCFPIIRKQVYAENPSYFPIDEVHLPYEYVRWLNEKTISIQNIEQVIIDTNRIEIYLFNILDKYKRGDNKG